MSILTQYTYRKSMPDSLVNAWVIVQIIMTPANQKSVLLLNSLSEIILPRSKSFISSNSKFKAVQEDKIG